MSKSDGHCSACGSRELSGSAPPWGDRCRPCEDRIKLEQPWFVPDMTLAEETGAEAAWKLKNDRVPAIQLESCPFCGAEQDVHGVHFCVVHGRAPYIIECMRCRGRTGGCNSFDEAARYWNMRPKVTV